MGGEGKRGEITWWLTVGGDQWKAKQEGWGGAFNTATTAAGESGARCECE